MGSLRVAVFVAAVLAVVAGARQAEAQPVRGVCASCSSASGDRNCGACMVDGDMCFTSLPAAQLRPGAFETSDHRDGRDASLHFARLVGGMAATATDFMRAVNTGYNGRGALFYGAGAPTGWCGSPDHPLPAYPSASGYVFGWNHTPEDALDRLDCYNGEIDRYYLHDPGHADGQRVCDGEQARFDPASGAVFDLGGEANRVVIFPYTDHPPLPCESFEYTVWLSDDPHATLIADAGRPDPTKWNPSQLTRAFLQGWIPDVPVAGQPVSADPRHPNLANPTQRDGFVQVFSLPCGLTFRYASIVAGNNGTPSPSCTFYSYDAELDAVLGLNEDDTALCPDADADGYRDAACGGNDCNDHDPAVHPGAIETCATGRDLNCDGRVTTCPGGTTCAQDLCTVACPAGGCPSGFTCASAPGVTGRYCIPSACVGAVCPAGQVCGPRGCQDPCAGAMCPAGLVCRGGACTDPCAGITCPSGQHCDAGRCAANCVCTGCTAVLACDTASGRCESPGCATFTCPAGMSRDCTGPMPHCVGPCLGVTCPLGAVCDPRTSRCVTDFCFGVVCPTDSACADGICVALPPVDAGMPDAGVPDAGVVDAALTDLGATDLGATDVTDASPGDDVVASDAGTDAGVDDGGSADGTMVADGAVADGAVTDGAVTDGTAVADGAVVDDGATDGSVGRDGALAPAATSGGCGCRTQGNGDGGGVRTLGLLALAAVVVRRRRRDRGRTAAESDALRLRLADPDAR